MTVKECNKFSRCIKDLVKHCGGGNNVHSLTSIYNYMIPTRAGLLLLKVEGNKLYCCFLHPDKAAELLPDSYRHRLNKYSGKWNFLFDGDVSASEALEYFKSEFQYVE